VADHTGRYVEVNRAACRMSGYTEEELLELSIPDFLAPDFLSMGMASFEKLKTEGHSGVDLMVRRKNGETFWINLVSTTIEHDRVLAFCQDITKRKQAEEEIQQMAYHDSLTGLPNRKLFSDRMGVALAQARRDQKGVAVIMLDLDNFKDVNDTLGHDVGDRLLIAAADRLGAALRKSDTVARFGGDEFALILPDLKGTEDVDRVARKIVDGFRKPFLIDTHQLIVTTSIGIAVYPQDGATAVILLKNADIAMYQVKRTGRDRYQLFSPNIPGLARADGTKNAF
jgi:diguanylate cyclase (GGDEF)-like protein/PAS domain S-box-containing protein